MEMKEQRDERERAREVRLYLQERYEQVDKKISNFASFPEEIQLVLNKYIDVFDTKLRKSIKVEPVRLNVREGSIPRACYSCRPTPAHYREAGMNLVNDLLDQNIIQYCGDSRSEWYAPAHLSRNQEEIPWHFAWWWIFHT